MSTSPREEAEIGEPCPLLLAGWAWDQDVNNGLAEYLGFLCGHTDGQARDENPMYFIDVTRGGI